MARRLLARRDPARLAYVYLTVMTPLVFGLFGRVLGMREDAQRAAHRKVERLREEFTAVVAHDLRGPIQNIVLQLDALLSRANGAELRVPVESLRRVLRGGERLTEMVADLLDASRLEASRLRVAPASVSLPGAIRELLDRIEPALGGRTIELHLEGAAPPVRVDPGRFDQILTNLLENSVKYSSDGTPIVIRVRPEDNGAALSVEDHGPGVPAEELPKLFDRFYQAQRAREKKSGLGLGLYITRGLVEAHGGHIDVSSVPGSGSIFTVWLPSASAVPLLH